MTIADPFNCPAHHETTITIATGGDAHPHDSSLRTITLPAANQYGLEATALARAILDGAASPVPHEDTVANFRVLERLFDAAGLPGPRG